MTIPLVIAYLSWVSVTMAFLIRLWRASDEVPAVPLVPPLLEDQRPHQHDVDVDSTAPTMPILLVASSLAARPRPTYR